MCVGIERTITNTGVVIACGVDTKYVSTVGRVVAARICGKSSPTKRLISGGSVVVTAGAHVECPGIDGRVAHSGRLVLERIKTDGRVVVPGCVKSERVSTDRGVVVAGGVEQQRVKPECRVG